MRKFYSLLILFFIVTITHAQIVTRAWATLASDAKPVAIAVDANGNLFTANYENNTISKITPDGTVTEGWAHLNSNPIAIAINGNNTVYTLNSNNSISRIIPNGDGVAQMPGWAYLASGADAKAIAIDASGNVYTANKGNNTVSKITPDGVVSHAWATVDKGPTSIAIAPNGNVYTQSQNRGSVCKITPDGIVSKEWVKIGGGLEPLKVAVGANGNVYTANFSIIYSDNTVSKITPDGTLTRAFASLPYSISFDEIAVDANNNVYTANSDNTISKITPDGTFTHEWVRLESGASAKGLAISNSLYTVNNGNNTVSKIDYCSTDASIVAIAPKRCGLNGSIELNTITGNTNIGSNNFSSAIATPWSVGGNATINNGQMQLNTVAANNNGYLLLTPTAKPASFSASFDLNMYRTTTINADAGDGDGVADGMSFNYGDITTPSGDYENGILSGNGLVVRYKIHQTQRIEVVYNGSVIGTYYADLHYPTALKCMIAVTNDGKFSLRLGDSILVNNLDLGTAYATDNKSAWKFGWAARSGGSTERHAIDNIVIDNNNGLLYSIDDFTTQQSLPYFRAASGSYTVKSKAASCSAKILGTTTIPAFSLPNLKITDDGTAPTCARTITITHDALPYDTLVWSDFATRPTISNASNLGNATFNGSASLTTNGNDQNGRIVFNPTRNASVFKATFNARIWDGSGADGISFNYGPIDNISGGQGGMFNPGTAGLTVSFLTFNGGKVRVKYNNIQLGTDYNATIRSDSYIPIEISVDENYKLTVKVNGTTIVNAYDLFTTTTYSRVSHSNWQFGIGGFTGGANDNHNIDNLLITGKPGIEYVVDGASRNSTVSSFSVSKSAQSITINMDGCTTVTQLPAWGTTNTIIASNSAKTATVPATFGDCGPYLITNISSVSGPAPYQGPTTAQVWIENTQPTGFVKRHYQITPGATATGTEAFVRLYFTQAEFDAFNAVNATKLPTSSTDAAGIANVRIEKRSGSSNDGTGLPASYTGAATTIDPTDNQIVWIAAKNVWEVGFYVSGFSGFFVKTQSVVLPIELLSFEASAQNGTNLLTWRTASETNNLGFDVERSQDGINFHKITFVKGKNKPSTYQYVDNVVYSTTYYRLKQLDNDGKTSYSNIVSVAQKGLKKGLKIYPTLVSNNILNVDTEGVSHEYNIYNLMGQTLLKGKTGQAIDVSALPQGTYIIKVGTETAKFVKQ